MTEISVVGTICITAIAIVAMTLGNRVVMTVRRRGSEIRFRTEPCGTSPAQEAQNDETQ